MKLNLLVLRTRKLEDLRSFYSALGARFKSERHGSGPEHYAAVLEDGFVLELYPCVDGTEPNLGLQLGVRVDNIAETLLLLGQSDALHATDRKRAMIYDPDGRKIELLQPKTLSSDLRQGQPSCTNI